MRKNNIAVFFSIIFLLFITVPTVIIVINDSVDVTFFYSSSEEESGNKQLEKVKIILSPIRFGEFKFSYSKEVNCIKHHSKKYARPYLSTTFPPPELA